MTLRLMQSTSSINNPQNPDKEQCTGPGWTTPPGWLTRPMESGQIRGPDRLQNPGDPDKVSNLYKQHSSQDPDQASKTRKGHTICRIRIDGGPHRSHGIRIGHPIRMALSYSIRMNYNLHSKWMDPAVYRIWMGTYIQTLSRTYTDGLTRAQLTS